MVWAKVFVQRFGLMQRSQPNPDDFTNGDATKRYFQSLGEGNLRARSLKIQTGLIEIELDDRKSSAQRQLALLRERSSVKNRSSARTTA